MNFQYRVARFALLLSMLPNFSFAGTLGDTPQEKNWYAGARGGLNIPLYNYQQGLMTTYKTGYNAVGELGHWFGDFALEVEGGYLSSRVSRINGGATNPFIISNSGSTSLAYGMVNGYYGIQWAPKVRPYVGFGIGGGALQPSWRFNTSALQINNNLLYAANTLNQSKATFVYQAIAGMAYSLNEHVNFSVDYRFLGTTNVNFQGRENIINANTGALTNSALGSQRVRLNTNLINFGLDYYF